jgi:hypothetical protein
VLNLALALLAAASVETTAAAEPELHHSSFGVLADLGIGSGLAGDHLAGDLGLQLFGLRDYDRRWLLFWDAALTVKLGGLANEHPYMFFGGGVVRASAELGRRLLPDDTWSAYVSLRGAASLALLGAPGVSNLSTINDADGFGGLTTGATVRASLGPSYLEHARSLVFALFFQESLRAPRTNTPGLAFTDVGLSLRFDLPERFTLAVEGLVGLTPNAPNAALGLTTQYSHAEASGFLRKTFHNGVWLGLAMSFGRDSARVAYDSGQSFDTARPPDFEVAASFGFPIGVKL